MGRAHSVKRRRSKSFNYNTNRKSLWKKSKKLPHIQCQAVREAWEDNKGVYRNLKEMGLSADPNTIQKIPSAKEQFKEILNSDSMPSTSTSSKKRQKLRKGHVVDALVEEASKPMESTFHMSNEIGAFVKYMINKYEDDYKKMARDPRNHYQLTPKQIKRKIETYGVSKYLDAIRLANKT